MFRIRRQNAPLTVLILVAIISEVATHIIVEVERERERDIFTSTRSEASMPHLPL
jgi:hypothetical protein